MPRLGPPRNPVILSLGHSSAGAPFFATAVERREARSVVTVAGRQPVASEPAAPVALVSPFRTAGRGHTDSETRFAPCA